MQYFEEELEGMQWLESPTEKQKQDLRNQQSEKVVFFGRPQSAAKNLD